MRFHPIALLTDFGTRDWYVAALKGVILSRAPGVRVIDITHEIPPQDIQAGAFTLAAAARWFPVGTIFVAVVDPGVGGRRALLGAQADGRYFLGPDNGLLAPSLEQAKRLTVIRLTNRRYWLPQVSATFHGRDILAPVAAHLARGGSLRPLGQPAPRYATGGWTSVRRHGQRVEGRIRHIDRFGNLITTLPGTVLARAGPGVPRGVRYRGHRARVVSSYVDGRPGELVAVVGSLGLVELAVREGSAAKRCRARRGERVEFISKFMERP